MSILLTIFLEREVLRIIGVLGQMSRKTFYEWLLAHEMFRVLFRSHKIDNITTNIYCIFTTHSVFDWCKIIIQ